MPRLSDVLKNKNHGETPWERQQRLEIEDQIAAQAILQEEAALQAEKENELIDTVAAIGDPIITPVSAPRKPPVKRKRQETVEEKRAKAAARKRKSRCSQSQEQLEAIRAQDAQAKINVRSSQSQEKLDASRAQDAQAKRKARENESANKRSTRKAADNARHKIQRQAETEEKSTKRKSKHAKEQMKHVESQYGEKKLGIQDLHEADLPEECKVLKLPSIWDSTPCPHCHSHIFPHEETKTEFCCKKGELCSEIPILDPPQVLKDIIEQESNYRKDSRKINNIFSFTSLGFDNKSLPQAPGNKHFKPNVIVQGQMHHRIGPLRPEDGEKSFAQFWVHDEDYLPEEEVQARLRTQKSKPSIKRETLEKLQEMLRMCNPYINDFKTVSDLPDEITQQYKFVLRYDKKARKEDHERVFNAPTCNEIALVALNEAIEPADVQLHLQGGGLKTMPDTNRSFDPMRFVLLFPYGEEGWSWNKQFIHKQKDPKTGQMLDKIKNLTPAMFYRYKFMVRSRDHSFNLITKSGRIMQEYACVSHYKIERQKLKYLQTHQDDLHVESYQGVMDAISRHDNVDLKSIGQRTVLPASYYGSPRWYQSKYLDGMALVRKYGKPHLLLTMTANPKWPEVLASLHHGEDSKDRPDIIERVFELRFRNMLEDITKKHVLGKPKAYMWVREYQKRGLPHIHMEIWLAEEDAPKNPDCYDRFVVAEVPNPDTDPILYEMVKKHMLHGPCGVLNPDCSCMFKEGKKIKECSKKYPMPYSKHTTQNQQMNKPQYRRRSPADGGRTITQYCRATKREVTLDNRWVVPFNPYLLRKFDCHLNLEIVASVMGIKYITKYLTKGSDRVMVENSDGTMAEDEIQTFINARYITASMALGHIFGLSICEISPSVIKLALHLPHQQPVYLTENRTAQEAMEKAKVTSLTRFFELNSQDPEARKFCYMDILQYYSWNESGKLKNCQSQN